MNDYISKARVCEILADVYPTDGEKVVEVKKINKAYEEIIHLPTTVEPKHGNDLISRRAAIKAIEDLQDCYNGFSDTYDKACIIGVIEEVPPIEPTKHGRWLDIERAPWTATCSVCGIRQELDYAYYCAYCGARMDEVEE